jgi:hypothetical protein
MGKAARLNRERREKATKDAIDWGTPKAMVLIKRSVVEKWGSIWIDAGFPDELILDGLKATLLSFVLLAAIEDSYLSKRISTTSNRLETTAHIIRDDDDFWVINKEEGVIRIALNGFSRDFSLEKDMINNGVEDGHITTRELLGGLLKCPKDYAPTLYFYGEGESFSMDTLK